MCVCGARVSIASLGCGSSCAGVPPSDLWRSYIYLLSVPSPPMLQRALEQFSRVVASSMQPLPLSESAMLRGWRQRGATASL